MADNKFIFGGVDSSSYGIYVGGDGTFNAPERVVDMVEIPGKNGALTIDDGRFENIEVTYSAFNYEETISEFRDKLAALRNALCSKVGYHRLEDSLHPDEYRMAVYRSGLEVKPIEYNTASEFEIKFDCKPQRFLTSGENVYTRTASGSITNPTAFESKPLLVVTGTGKLTVNGVQIQLSQSPTTIDCEAMEAYNGTTSRNGSIVLTPNRFPVLKAGNNTITLGAGITKVEITPRWWRV
jgi:phage-related protein